MRTLIEELASVNEFYKKVWDLYRKNEEPKVPMIGFEAAVIGDSEVKMQLGAWDSRIDSVMRLESHKFIERSIHLGRWASPLTKLLELDEDPTIAIGWKISVGNGELREQFRYARPLKESIQIPSNLYRSKDSGEDATWLTTPGDNEVDFSELNEQIITLRKAGEVTPIALTNEHAIGVAKFLMLSQQVDDHMKHLQVPLDKWRQGHIPIESAQQGVLILMSPTWKGPGLLENYSHYIPALTSTLGKFRAMMWNMYSDLVFEVLHGTRAP